MALGNCRSANEGKLVKPRPQSLKDELERKRSGLPRSTLNMSRRLVNEQIVKTLVIVAVESEPALQRFCIDAEAITGRHLGAAELL